MDQTTQEQPINILPYNKLVGQDELKLALELTYIAPRIGGVLISGHRGTGKSTAVRAFARMMYNGELPVTLPINATEDRVIGGWNVEQLMLGNPVHQDGLLVDANGKLLYIDEVNLLDDHIINIILDVTSTGVLLIQREGLHEPPKELSFTLVGTMNPEEGGLRPQLLDRFGLLVEVNMTSEEAHRRRILEHVIEFDEAVHRLRHGLTTTYFEENHQADAAIRAQIIRARERLYDVVIDPPIARLCVQVANAFQIEGYRGDYIMALAARAYATQLNAPAVTKEHVAVVAPLALRHRRQGSIQGKRELWDVADKQALAALIDHA